MDQTCRPLKEIVAEIVDPRGARGKRHSLEAVLMLVCVATLCGYRSYSAMAEWGRNYGGDLLRALGFTHPRPPSAATLYRVLRALDRRAVDAAFGQWAQEAVAALPVRRQRESAGLAIDGKRLRGSQRQGAQDTHLLSALSHRLGLTLAQTAVADKTNEITAIQEVLRGLVLEGRVVTVDALLTQREVARTIVRQGGDYVMTAKENQPDLLQAIHGMMATPAHLAAPIHTAEQGNRGHGRRERRRLEMRALLPDDLDWPGAQQIFRLERTRVLTKTGLLQREMTYGLTSLASDQTTPASLLRLIRGHWSIENTSHYIRDVTFDEDRSQVRIGATPHILATVRSAMIGLLHRSGHTNVAAATRHYAAQPHNALALLGLSRK